MSDRSYHDVMQQLPLRAPAGWLLVNFIITVGLLLSYSHIPHPYRRLVLKLRWVLLPYSALMTGALSPRLMGITGIDWLASFGLGLGLVAAVLGLLLLVRSTADFSPPALSQNIEQHIDPQAKEHSSPEPSVFPIIPPSYQSLSLSPLFDAGAEELYWSFLRGALWETAQFMFGSTDQVGYWAIWLATLVALPEILRFQATLTGRLFKIILLLLTTVLFLYTQNFWLCWLLHALVLSLLMP